MLRKCLFLILVVGCLGLGVQEKPSELALHDLRKLLRPAKNSPVVPVVPLVDLPPGVHLDNDHSIQNLKDDILRDEARLDELKEDIRDAMRANDQATVDTLKEEVGLIFQDLQYKWDILKQLLGITLSMEHGLQHITDKWHLQPDSGNDTALSDILSIPGLPLDIQNVTLPEIDNPIDPNWISSTGSDTSSEELIDPTDIDAKFLKKAREYLKQIKSGSLKLNEWKAEAEDTEQQLTKRGSCSEVPNTNQAVTLLGGLKTSSDNGASCAERVKDKAKTVKDAITRFHKMSGHLTKVKNGLVGLYNVLIPLSRMPYVGGAASTVKTAITPMKINVVNFQTKVAKVDRKVYPSWKNRMETVRRNADKAENGFKKASKKCQALNNYVTAARDCICEIPSSSDLKDPAVNSAETATGPAWHGGHLTTVANGYKTVTSACTVWDNLLNSIISKMSIPGLDKIYNALNSLLSSLGPLFDIFGEINIALNHKFCVPDPVEVAAEALKDSARWAAERAEEIKEGLGGWRRKRSLHSGHSRQVFLNKKEAHDFLTSGLIRRTRAGDVCFSVQDLINGVSAVFDFVLGWAEDLLDKILKKINFSIPGLPNFNLIDIDFLNGFNLPSLDLNIDLNFALPFLRLGVPTINLNVPRISLSMSLPDFTVDLFNLNWKPPTFNLNMATCRLQPATPAPRIPPRQWWR